MFMKRSRGVQVVKLSLPLTLLRIKLVCLSVLSNISNLIFYSGSVALPSGALHRVGSFLYSQKNILTENFLGTNTLAYFVPELITKEKGFMR